MMGERPAPESTEIVILVATALLGVVLGTAVAFGLWTQLTRSSSAGLLSPAVAVIGIGLSLAGFGFPRFATRLFFIALGAALVAAFFFGGALFKGIAS
ncbi:MAG: hypothetical protein M3N13_09370 [Candidatus Eremiobacteraeota bacterium]|nr:hypothetical protein [Candidatus Eremiobacteraeota bacterium]